MAQREPLIPTVNTLRATHPLTLEAELDIATMRDKVNAVLGGRAAEMLIIVGPCAMTLDNDIIERENNKIATLDATNESVVALHRMPPWKPRTNPDDWHGLGTTEPGAAFSTLHAAAESHANVAIELGHTGHMQRYADMLSLGWVGARNDSNTELMHSVALHDPRLPIAIKNNLDGTIDTAMSHIHTIKELRSGDPQSGEVALLYRGGSQFTTPEAWEDQVLVVMEHARSEGVAVVVDTAHGSEMAHDPHGNFQKSIEGQVACLKHLGDIALRTGMLPHGVMVEATDAKSPTDPVIPFSEALRLVKVLAGAKSEQVVYGVSER